MRGQEEKKGKKRKEETMSEYLLLTVSRCTKKKKRGIEEDKLERDQMSVSLDMTRVETTVGLMDNLI